VKVLSVFGTRPEAIKMAPVVQALISDQGVRSVVCVTGQHKEMLAQVLDLFGIVPHYDLAVMTAGQTLNGLAAKMIRSLDEVLEEERPDRVLVHGDTTTAMAATIAAFQRGVPIGHVEAGLRTYDLRHPWPEELNRRIVDVASDMLFAPTSTAKANLSSERLSGQVIITGNTVIDALKATTAILDRDASLAGRVDARLPETSGRLVLVTGHRRESFGDGFERICEALKHIALLGDIDVVYPVHLNPQVQEPVRRHLSGLENVHLIAPQGYLPFVRLMQRAQVILTDSGGVQEEAPSLGKPVLVMRTVTERPEAVAAGAVELVGTDPKHMVERVAHFLRRSSAKDDREILNPYGDGNASFRILRAVCGLPVEEFAPKPAATVEVPRAPKGC
jgi:UDP-N-acetylglucosamine 2-epimerase (non-hydrolysing)